MSEDPYNDSPSLSCLGSIFDIGSGASSRLARNWQDVSDANPGDGAELMNGANSVDEISSAGGDLVDPTQLDEEVVPAAQSLVEATPQPEQQARHYHGYKTTPPPPKLQTKRNGEQSTPSQQQEPQPKLAPVPPRQGGPGWVSGSQHPPLGLSSEDENRLMDRVFNQLH